MKRVLVTGGAGFIGAHLTRRLLQIGYAVTVLDDLSSGRHENVPVDARFVEGSILDSVAIREVLSDADACIHLAAVSSVEKCKRQLTSSHAINLTGFLRIIEELASSRSALPLVYASSAAVYGASQDLPLLEGGHCTPLSPYGADKLSCELHARAAYEVYGMSSLGLRFFNVYGPGQDPASPYAGVIAKFVERLKRGEDITIHGDGCQTRDFVYIDDVVGALVQAIGRWQAGAGILNVCRGEETSINDLAKTMIEETGAQSTIRRVDGLLGEVRRSKGNVQALNEKLDYQCRTDLRTGLAHLLR
ncbi:MAG TPA: NAD-dependent epimerase/dehydratase family protein [Ensifer sp.]|uniref:NAD-dependent epimerase/dehydratase family protein n=1 Tax=Ensifer sp. TaxID=1872086 RepID=UPI002E13483B|nr:NAD-dependent epimerase/dehydratase family protein [Ensifer sp.]